MSAYYVLSTALMINLTKPSSEMKEHLNLKGSSSEHLPLKLKPSRTTAPLVKIPLLSKDDLGCLIPQLLCLICKALLLLPIQDTPP